MPKASVRLKFTATLDEGSPVRKIPNKGELSKIYKRITISTGKDIRTHFTKTIQSNFSRKNRARINSSTGTGFHPGMSGWSVATFVGTNEGQKPLRWLEEGTSIRWRGVSPDWVSKTRPNSGLTFRSGRGRAINFWAPFPGIAARNFRDAIIDDIEDLFYERVERQTTWMWRKYLR